MNGFKASKCFEGSGPTLIWAVSVTDAEHRHHKLYLHADAHQQRFGVRMATERGDDLKVNGAVVSLVRKHARTAFIAGAFRDPASGHIWLPLFTSRSERPDFWVQLAKASPPELRLIDAVGTALVRKTSQGTYTKRWQLQDALPPYPLPAGMEDLTGGLVAAASVDSTVLGAAAGTTPAGDEQYHSSRLPHAGGDFAAGAAGTAWAVAGDSAAAQAAVGDAAAARAAVGDSAAARAAAGDIAAARAAAGDIAAAPAAAGDIAEARAALGDSAADQAAVGDGAAARAAAGDSAGERAAAGAAPTQSAPTVPAGGSPETLLAPYQKLARDRLARRQKTLRKALTKLAAQQAASAAVQTLTVQAQQLAAHLHLVQPGAFQLVLSPAQTGLATTLEIPLDPEQSAGQNLSKLHVAIKKARRGDTVAAAQHAAAAGQLAALTEDLAVLRSTPLPLASVEQMLRRHHLPRQGQTTHQGASTERIPYRTILWRANDEPAGAAHSLVKGRDPQDLGVRILVGKTAADSDELCRQAKGHDLWLHVVGTTGSHVIIPARQLKTPPVPALLRAAGILALHFSKLRDDHRGEVYLSRRQFIKKRKGMPPGLWQIDQAETLFFGYEESEVQQLLSQVGPE